MDDIKNIIESLLIVSKEPLTSERIKKVLDISDTKEIRNMLKTLSDEYEARKGGFFLKEVAGGYQIRTRPEYKEWIKRLIQPNPVRLSKAAMETLAIIAYRQPVIRSDVEYIRGVDCGGVIRMLLERKLVRILGRKEIPGRPLIYGTTKQFLEVFDLKDLKDLPTLREIEELGNFSSESKFQLPLNAVTGNNEAAEFSPDPEPSAIESEGETDAAPSSSDESENAQEIPLSKTAVPPSSDETETNPE